MGPSRVTLTTTLHLPHLLTTRRQIDPGDRLETRLQSKPRQLLGEEYRRLLTTPNDVEFYPLHSPSTRRDHRPVPTTIKILRTWSQRSSDITNMVPRQGIQRQEPCPSVQLFLTSTQRICETNSYGGITHQTIAQRDYYNLYNME